MTTIALVRHVRAEAARPGSSDTERRLSDEGREQAQQLPQRLSSLWPTRLIASPAVRCQATLEPFATRTGVAIEVLPILAAAADPTPVMELLSGLLSEETTAVICSHGDLIPAVLDALIARHRLLPLPTTGPPGSAWLLRCSARGAISLALLDPD